MNRLSAFCVVALLTAGFLWPSEAAMHGNGLHLAAFWLALAAIHPVFEARFGFADRFGSGVAMVGSRRQSWLTAGMVLLIAGFWLSTWNVFHVSGDRRAALNLAFEWSGIFAAGWLLSRLASAVGGRERLVSVLVGLAAGLSLLGVWQHFWLYDMQAEWYRGLTGAAGAETRDSAASGAFAATDAGAELQLSGVPMDKEGRELFERRLLSSSEPYGTFSLANTLGGMLAVAMVIVLSVVASLFRNSAARRWGLLVLLAAAALAIAYCLMLTKCRTAWVGTVVGTLAVILAQSAGRNRRRVWTAVVGVCIVAASAAGIGIAAGVIDKEVVLEAPRSLQFRLFYWTGAARVIGENPIFGSGPGNFRQRYLIHKPVQSSEEILDPHNILLDAWSSAGLIGLAGLLIVFGAVVWQLACGDPDDGTPGEAALVRPATFCMSGRLTAAAVCAGWGMHWLIQEFAVGAWDASQTVALAVPACAAAMALAARRGLPCSRATAAAAALTLFVHLLGAGGLQISAVGLLLVLLVSLAMPLTRRTTTREFSRVSTAWTATRSVGFAGLATATVVAGVIPVQISNFWLLRGDYAAGNRDNGTAETAWQRAAEADSIAVIPRQRLAEAATYRLMAQAYGAAGVARAEAVEEFQETVVSDGLAEVGRQSLAACEALIRNDEWHLAGYHFRARQYQILAAHTDVPQRKQQHLLAAIADQRRVLEAYPSNGTYWMELAAMYQAAEQPEQASVTAARSLEIDDINRQWGHLDRFRGEHERKFLESLAHVGR